MRDYGAFGDASGERIALLLEAGQHWDRASVSSSYMGHVRENREGARGARGGGGGGCGCN